MCRSKEDGGRRCPAHSDPIAIAAYNAKRREKFQNAKVAAHEVSDYGFQSPDETRVVGTSENELRPESIQELSHLDSNHLFGIRTFTGNSFFWMNEALYGRTGSYQLPSHFESTVGNLDSAFISSPMKERITYRGKGLDSNQFDGDKKKLNRYVDENYAVGSEVVFDGYLSTSLDPVIGGGYAGSGGIIFEMKSGSGLNVASQALYYVEAEALLPRATRWKVISVSKNSEYKAQGFLHGAESREQTFDSMTVVQMVEVDENGDEFTQRKAPPAMTEEQRFGKLTEEDDV